MRDTIRHIENGVTHEFEVMFEVAGYCDTFVKIGPDGKKAVVGYLSRDEDPINPRTEYNNVGTMVCWHRNYNLGDDSRRDSAEEFLQELAITFEPGLEDKIYWWNNDGYEREEARIRKQYPDAKHWEVTYTDDGKKVRSMSSMVGEITEERINKLVRAAIEKHYVMLPLYLYDHGGLSISTGAFSCPWDSGLVGWIYADRDTMLREWGGSSKRLTKQIKDKARKCLVGEVENYDQYLRGDVYGVCYQAFVRDGSVYEGECSACGATYPELLNGSVCMNEECPSNEEPQWVERDERGVIGYNGDGTPIHGDVSRDECWGFYGDKYAEEELKDGMGLWDEWLATPTPPDNSPEQGDMFTPEFQMAA